MRLFTALSAALTLSAFADVPQVIHYQGRIVVGGTNFTGAGQFKFALVDAGGAVTFWSNGVSAVSLPVSGGLFSALLGDTTISNMTFAVPVTVFTNSDVRLRVQFDDGVAGFQTLSPDQRIAAVGYALMAASVPSNSITGAQIASGSIVNAHIDPSAAIADAKLATISTPGKVANSALSANVSLLGQTVESSEVDASSFDTTFWKATGNAGTTPGTHFIGTTDGAALRIAAGGGAVIESALIVSNSATITGTLTASNFVGNVITNIARAISSGGTTGQWLFAIANNSSRFTNQISTSHTSEPFVIWTGAENYQWQAGNKGVVTLNVTQVPFLEMKSGSGTPLVQIHLGEGALGATEMDYQLYAIDYASRTQQYLYVGSKPLHGDGLLIIGSKKFSGSGTDGWHHRSLTNLGSGFVMQDSTGIPTFGAYAPELHNNYVRFQNAVQKFRMAQFILGTNGNIFAFGRPADGAMLGNPTNQFLHAAGANWGGFWLNPNPASAVFANLLRDESSNLWTISVSTNYGGSVWLGTTNNLTARLVYATGFGARYHVDVTGTTDGGGNLIGYATGLTNVLNGFFNPTNDTSHWANFLPGPTNQFTVRIFPDCVSCEVSGPAEVYGN